MNKLKLILISAGCIGLGIMLAVNSVSIAGTGYSFCVKNNINEGLTSVNLYAYNDTETSYTTFGPDAISDYDRQCWMLSADAYTYTLLGVAYEAGDEGTYTCCSSDACINEDKTSSAYYLTNTDVEITKGNVTLVKEKNCPTSYAGRYTKCAKWPLSSGSYIYGYCTESTSEKEDKCATTTSCTT